MSKGIQKLHGSPMTRIEKSRTLVKKEKSLTLLMILGSTYIEWLKWALLKDSALAYYIFARIFEKSQIHGESGVHKHITSLTIHPDKIGSYNDDTQAVSVTLDITANDYYRLRNKVIGLEGKRSSFPPFTEVEQ